MVLTTILGDPNPAPVDPTEAVRRLYDDAFNEGWYDDLRDLLAPDVVVHDPSYPRDLHGVSEVVAYARGFRESFPDLHVDVADLVTADDCDRIVARLDLSGTHEGEFMGAPPTDRRFSAPGIAVHRFHKGRLAEVWFVYDALGVLRQLGVFPMSVAAA